MWKRSPFAIDRAAGSGVHASWAITQAFTLSTHGTMTT